MNPIRFQGLYVFEGGKEKVKAEAKKVTSGINFQASDYENGQGRLYLVTEKHAERFAEQIGINAKLQWWRPIRTIKTILAFPGQFNAHLKKVGLDQFAAQLKKFVEQQEAAGEKVTRTKVD